MPTKSVNVKPDLDPEETKEWLEALESVCQKEGVARAHYLIERLIDQMRRSGAHLPYKATTAYVNTIHADAEPEMPGEPGLEHRIRSIIRWNALALVVQAYAAQLRPALAAVRTFDQKIAAVFARHPDQELFASFPGAGAVGAPRLAAAFGTDRTRWDAATELQTYSGIAPVTVRSGKTHWVHHRLACPKFLKQTFHEYADQSIRFSTWARRYYDQQRARGNNHHAALRALAFKWIRILFRCWKDRTPYDEATYLAALRRKGSPLVTDLT